MKKTIKKRVYIASRYSASSDFMNFEKGLNCYYQITSQSCILCAAETFYKNIVESGVFIYFGTDGCNFGRAHYKKHFCEIICV